MSSSCSVRFLEKILPIFSFSSVIFSRLSGNIPQAPNPFKACSGYKLQALS